MKRLITIALVWMSLSAHATDFSVSSVAECTIAMKKVVAGDRIIWKNGTYADVKINFKPANKGIAKNMIYLQAETAGKVIFTGSSQLGISGEYLQVEGFTFKGISSLADGENVITYADLDKADHSTNHVRVTNCAIVDYTLTNDQVENKWVLFYGSYNELDHCSFIGKKNQGATVVVNYYKSKNYVDGSETAPSTYHIIHHNYFGWRTMPNDNGGEHIRIGDSKTSFTKGFNIVEYNFFEKHLLEPEVISNKSCDNIYRFNTFIGNDGALVLRHGNRCVVYGNYFNGEGSSSSGGIRIIGDHHIVFNNYLENLTGGNAKLKAPVTIMSGVVGTALNGYYTANDAIVCNNTIVQSVGPVFRIGIGSKGKEYNAPSNIVVANNLIIDTRGKEDIAAIEDMPVEYKLAKNNRVVGTRLPAVKGFETIRRSEITLSNKLYYQQKEQPDKDILAMVRDRLQPLHISIDDKDIVHFKKEWIVNRSSVGVNWKL